MMRCREYQATRSAGGLSVQSGGMSEVRANREPLVAPGGIDHHVADLTATFSADVTLGAAAEKLATAGQWLPIDGEPSAMLGKLIELNSTGPLRLGYGAWRDLLLGAQFLNGRDELITAGGRAVKNVAGYDLTKFIVGQGGVFGRVVTVTTRTYKRPGAAMVAKFEPDLNLVNRVMPTDLRAQWMVVDRDNLWMGYVNDERTVEYCAGRLAELKPASVERRTIEEDIEHRRKLWKAEGERTFRVAVAPSRIMEFVQAAKISGWAADAAFGVVIGGCAAGDLSRIREAGTRVSGTVTFFDGDEIEYESPSEWHRLLLERLKHSFDPEERLNPLPWRKRA